MSEALHTKECVPCRKGTPALSQEKILHYLRELPQWHLSEDACAIIARRQFKNYAQALNYVNRVSVIAESQNHHPDITFGWGYVTITLRTHSINGLHENDFIVAAKINALTE